MNWGIFWCIVGSLFDVSLSIGTVVAAAEGRWGDVAFGGFLFTAITLWIGGYLGYKAQQSEVKE